jgi:alpha-D-ribose 1-methylphosphonate 5-triphosphate synthase subunit PhnG
MYSAAEWAAADPVASWDADLKAVHARWGGGRELSHASLSALLDLLCQLQATADEIAEVMLVSPAHI